VDLHGNGPASRALLAETRPRRLLAFGRDGPQWHPAEHEVTRWCRVIRQGLPAADLIDPPADGALPIPPGAPVVAGRTLLHCGAKSPARRWPAPRFAAVAAELRRAGHDVVITGGPRERGLTQTIARRAGVAAAELTSLPELLALVAAARLVISGDTGVAHVATNYRTPSVVLFGPVSPAIWGPPPQPYHQVLWHGDGMGNPHGDQLDPALDMITPAEVLAACQRALLPAAEAAHG
jgi:ADP-heptose:LPS heptosyltransferase